MQSGSEKWRGMVIKNKFGRVWEYALALLFFILLRPVAVVMRRLCPSYRRLWLVMERGNDARDNGYWFYRYLCEQHPEINARYVITPDSPDLKRITALGKPVWWKSFQHRLMYLCADRLVGSHVSPASPDLMAHYHLAQKGICTCGKQIFLQHGVIKNEMGWLHGDKLKLGLFVCGAKPEYDFVHDKFGHPEGVVQYLGLCRFDHLLTASAPGREIVLMPTWRGSHYPSGDAFVQTAFFKHYQGLLNHPKLIQLLEQADCRLIFYPHIELQKELRHFTSGSPRVVLASAHTEDVQHLLMRCAVLVTDHSSVDFDVAYLHKPVIYDQFDEAEFRAYHYQQGYFDYDRDGFGPVCRTTEELLSALERYIQSDFQTEPFYLQRAQRFFPLRDQENCRRIFDAVSALR